LHANPNMIIESLPTFPIPVKDRDSLREEIDIFTDPDDSVPSGTENDDYDSKGDDNSTSLPKFESFHEGFFGDFALDNLFLERFLHDDPIPLPGILDFSNIVRVFLPFFTYPVTSSILLSSKSEDTIFDPGISNYHFASLEPGVSHRSETFMKFNVYPNHLNESPMKILSSTCFPMDQ
nr:hypothetical protein [Tanacetum cinerariifolium]